MRRQTPPSASVNDQTNEAAARRILLEIGRRQLGGRVIIDFLPASNAAARAKLADTLKAGLKSIPKSRFGRLNADGLCDLTLPRTSLSLLEQATEPAGAGWPAKGRRFTRDWSAKAAIRTLEGALGARPSSRPRLIVGPEIADYLEGERPQWAERLKQKFGARFSIERSASMEPRDHDLAE
ncbi:MAG: ribonuclease E/G [Parvularculaceae bacterium]